MGLPAAVQLEMVHCSIRDCLASSPQPPQRTTRCTTPPPGDPSPAIFFSIQSASPASTVSGLTSNHSHATLPIDTTNNLAFPAGPRPALTLSAEDSTTGGLADGPLGCTTGKTHHKSSNGGLFSAFCLAQILPPRQIFCCSSPLLCPSLLSSGVRRPLGGNAAELGRPLTSVDMPSCH